MSQFYDMARVVLHRERQRYLAEALRVAVALDTVVVRASAVATIALLSPLGALLLALLALGWRAPLLLAVVARREQRAVALGHLINPLGQPYFLAKDGRLFLKVHTLSCRYHRECSESPSKYIIL